VLPTNVVCVYAPRFAEVRLSVGPNEALAVEGPVRVKLVEKDVTEAARQAPKRLTQNQAAKLARLRARASGLASRTHVGVHSELRVLSGYDSVTSLALNRLRQSPEVARDRLKAARIVLRQRPDAIKTAESAVVTGVVEGAGVIIRSWPVLEE